MDIALGARLSFANSGKVLIFLSDRLWEPVTTPAKYLQFATAIAVVLSLVSPVSAQTTLSKTELKCAGKLAKAASKLAGTYLRDMSRCRDSVINGKSTGPCPDSSTQSRIDGAVSKLEDTIKKSCVSTCSISGAECIADSLCPASGSINELCTAGAKDLPFDMTSLGFPGAQCELAIGKPITTRRDFADCVSILTQQASANLLDAIYGNIDGTVLGGKDVQRCLAAISKSGQKLVSTVYKGVIKCRSNIAKGKTKGDPRQCSFRDSKTVSKSGKVKTKLRASVEKRCASPSVLASIDVCGQGPGAMMTTMDVATCVIDAAGEIIDSQDVPSQRTYGPSSLLDAVFPPVAVCGDDMVNQGPDPFFPIGEECDGADDSACPGGCIPPGDVFECTCNNPPRLRFLGDGNLVDLDIGWKGAFHDLRIAGGAGFIAEMSECDCDDMDGAACSGNSADPVCTLTGVQIPRCEWDTMSGTRCDDHGDGDSVDEDADCFVCDAFSDNAGETCTNSSECTSRCFDFFDTPLNPCTSQADCAAGATCRGRCDDAQVCRLINNGAPTPSSTGGLGACTVTVYRENVTGTTNIVTGEHEIDMQQFARVHLGVTSSTPCPVCGGFCDGGNLDGEACLGRCTFSMSACRFDSDCGGGELCGELSPDCPSGECNLSPICSAGENAGGGCRIEAVNGIFGAVSSDCPPSSGQNITGQGLTISWSPRTSEFVGEPGSLACTAPGFELFNCPCAATGGASTRPNACATACNAGTEFGQGCATGGGNMGGNFTSCAGGVNAGSACDEDTDCPGGSCSDNPTHCTGDPAFELNACVANSDCGSGACVDACPAGRCVPLCMADPGDPEDGVCAAGPPTYHCGGFAESFRQCTSAEAGGSCDATCNKSGDPCITASECPTGESCEGSCDLARNCEAGSDGTLGNADDIPGAGICVSDFRQCPLFGVEGGDTLNGKGDPTNVRTVASFCLSATGSAAVNETAGIGGPGRLRQAGTNATNGFEQLP